MNGYNSQACMESLILSSIHGFADKSSSYHARLVGYVNITFVPAGCTPLVVVYK